MILRNLCRAALLSGVAVSGFSAGQAQATEASSDEAANPDEIVVTANRREQSLSDVGISVSVLDDEVLAKRGISSVSDLAVLVPGFTAGDSALNIPVYSLRGVGFNDGSLGANSTVSVYVDEVPLAYPAMTQGAVLDLQRIEVLKGPQGTLYGQNSTGGTINYIANKPTEDLAAGINVDFGRFNTMSVNGFINLPLSSTLKARFAAEYTRGDDWQYSITRNDHLGKVRRASVRGILNWEPSSDLSVTLNVNAWLDRSDSQALQLTQFTPQRPANVGLLPQVFSSPLAPPNARAADWTPGLDYGRDDDFQQYSLSAKYNLSDNIIVTSISSYSHYKGGSLIDRDAIVPRNFEVDVNGKLKSYYQEIRLGGNESNLIWSVGANYRNDHIDDSQNTSITDGTSVLNRYDLTPVISSQTVETYAAFADGELKIGSDLTLVGGIRYTKDKRIFAGCTADSGAGDLSAFFSPIMNALRGARGLAPLPAIPAGACVTLSSNLEPGLVHLSLDEDNVNYHAGVNWKPLPRTLFYASVSQGYKAGAFGTLGSSTAVANRPVGQERVNAYEVGIKASPFGRLLRVETAAFYYAYHDKQQRGRILDPTFGSLSTLVNVPRSRIYGFELSATLQPTQNISLYASYLNLNTKIQEFNGVNFVGQIEDFSGESLNYSPKNSLNIGSSIDIPVSRSMSMFFGADLTYRSKTSAFFGNVVGQEIDSYTLLDVQIGVRSNDDKWKLRLYGRNIFNEYYWNNVIRANDTVVRVAGRPGTYGIQFGYTF